MLPVAEVQLRVLNAMGILAEERVALADAHGRIAAFPLPAGRPLPGFAASAMDGFAVRSTDLPGTLPVAGAIAAGALDPAPLAPGTAVRIMTGAMLPAGADTVVILEDAHADGDRVTLPAAPVGENVRQPGEDIAVADLAVDTGTRLGSGELALLAALGYAEVDVRRRPRVAIIATGDELVDVRTPPRPGQLVDSSAYMLAAQIRDAGGEPTYLGVGRDDEGAIAALIERGLAYDVVVTTGGVSAGDHDHVRAAVKRAGVHVDLWKVAMKPGKPFAFGRSSGKAPVFALPGNPVSSWVAFELFVRPALRALQGAVDLILRPRAPVVLPGGYRKPAGRAHYLRARLARDGGTLVATPHARQGSAMLTSIIGVDALVEIPADTTEVAPGAVVEALLLGAV